MKGFKQIALALAAASAMSSALAAIPLPSGWYLEGNAGGSKTTSVTYAPGNSVSNSGMAWNLNGGYKFMPFFAAEVGYTRYSQAIAKVNGVKVSHDNHYSYDVAGKGILPVADTGVELFAKLGVSRINADVRADNSSYAAANGIVVNTGTHNYTSYYYGLGAAYSILTSLAANVQWQRANGNSQTGTLNLYSAGLSYLFG